jgi:hypothetical protein
MNPVNINFSIASASINTADFGNFLAFVRCRDCSRLSRDRVAAFLSISTKLRNHLLAVAGLSSLGAAAVSVNALPSAESAAKPKIIGERGIDDCASQFY